MSSVKRMTNASCMMLAVLYTSFDVMRTSGTLVSSSLSSRSSSSNWVRQPHMLAFLALDIPDDFPCSWKNFW